MRVAWHHRATVTEKRSRTTGVGRCARFLCIRYLLVKLILQLSRVSCLHLLAIELLHRILALLYRDRPHRIEVITGF